MKRTAIILLLSALVLAGADLTGHWPGMLETSRGADEHNLTLQQNGNSVTGTVAFSGKKWEIRNAKLEGRRLSFEITTSGATPWVLFYDLQVSGEEMAGSLTAKQGPFPGGKVRFRREK